MEQCDFVTEKYIGREKRSFQCVLGKDHEGKWHQIEVKNTSGTYKKTDVYMVKDPDAI